MVKVIAISLPEELVKVMDEAGKAVYASRSEYIRQALVSRLQQDGRLDEGAAIRGRAKELRSYLKSLQFDL